MMWKHVEVDYGQWHKWFAWYPVLTQQGMWVWMETVLRRIEFRSYDNDYYYRLLKGKHD